MHALPFQLTSPSIPANTADISDEMRDEALKRTTALLKSLIEIRQTLNLPPDQLPLVIESYGKTALALIAAAERADLDKRTLRVPLTMRSETRNYAPLKIEPGKHFDVIGCPQYASFLPENLKIHGDSARWNVHDILIGNQSQFIHKKVPVPGTEFGPGGILEHMRLATAQLAMHIVLRVEYIGPEAAGEVFEATMVGTALRS